MINLDFDTGKIVRQLIETYRRENNIPEPEELKKVYNKNTTFLESELENIYIEISENMIQICLGNKAIMKRINFEEQNYQEYLNKYSFVKNLHIIKSNVSKIDLSEFKNLQSLYIANNSNLENISGLYELKNLKFLDFFGNSSYSDVNSILNLAERVIEENGIAQIDLLYYPEYKEMYEQNNKNILLSKMKFSESTRNLTARDAQTNYSIFDVERMLKSAINDYNKYIKDGDTDYEKYAIIHSLILDNISYDFTSAQQMDSKGKVEVKNGFKGGSNSTYNALIKKLVVCQGYTHAMQFLLKLNNIKACDISCVAGTKEEMEKGVSNHSIQGIVLDGGMLYSDITFDVANKYNKKDKIIEYFLMTEEELKKNHNILTNITSIKKHPYIDPIYRENLIKFARERIASVNLQEEIEKTIENRFKVKLDLDNLEDIKKSKIYLMRLASIKYLNFLDLKLSEVSKNNKQKEREYDELEEDIESKRYYKDELPDIHPEILDYEKELEDRIDSYSELNYGSDEYAERVEITEETESSRIR